MNPLAGLPAPQYQAMYLLALKRDQDVPMEEAVELVEAGAASGRMIRESGADAVGEVWLNARPAEFYRVLWRLAWRRDQGVTRDEALAALKDPSGPQHDAAWEGSVDLIWGEQP